MKRFLSEFWADESGAVTVDWVVLTAATVGLALVIYPAIRGSSVSLTERTSSFMDGLEPSGSL